MASILIHVTGTMTPVHIAFSKVTEVILDNDRVLVKYDCKSAGLTSKSFYFRTGIALGVTTNSAMYDDSLMAFMFKCIKANKRIRQGKRIEEIQWRV